jgi:TQXA domain-containing protein
MTRVQRLAFAAVVVTAVVLATGPASAVPIQPPGPGARSASNTEMVMAGTGPGGAVGGFIGAPGTISDPSVPYPALDPAAPPPGFTSHPEGWDASDVPNVGYVAYLLNHYFPNVPTAPAGLGSDNERAAAVQAAIWYFSDNYVLPTTDPLRAAVAAIVEDARTNGPLVQPPPPSLTITPATQSGPVGSPVGPFTVSAAATVTSTGSMFADAGATQPIANPGPVGAGQQIWLTSALGSAVLQATASATVPSGNVYLYDGNSPPTEDAQRLILAQDATLTTTVSAEATFQPPGSLVVNKTITGPAAGQQGPIVISVTCDTTGVLLPLFTIPANTPASTVSHTYSPIPAGSICRVLETVDGHLPTVTARKAGSGISVTIPAGGTATANLSDTFDVGSLIVNKTITGAAAGQQGDVTIAVTCGATTLAPVVIPAGTAAGTVSQEYTGIPAGTMCTATETATGGSATISVTTQGSGQSITIAPNGSGTVSITDTYDLVPGALLVTKTFGGPAAGQQGIMVFLITCGGGHTFAYVLPPGTPAGAFPRVFTGIPAGSTCTVTEAFSGASDTVTISSVGSGQQATIVAAQTAAIDVSNSVEPLQTPTTPPTTEPMTMPETLPGTGGGSDAGGLLVVALAAGAGGALLLLVTRRRAS